MKDEHRGRHLSTASIAGSESAPRRRHDSREAPQPSRAPLLSEESLEDLRRRWKHVQSQFVDEPRRAVEHADSLVAELMMRIAESFANERSGLEAQWGRNNEVDTENLRLALQRYRSFFERLLDV